MILPDINILLYAHNSDDRHHTAARKWWDWCLQGDEGIALPWTVILGFVRLGTHARIFQNPFSPAEATERVEEWLTLPHVQVIHPAKEHFTRWRNLLVKIGTAGNLTTDAHLAALAIERGLTLATTDSDFARFPGLKWMNPLESGKARTA